MRKIKIFAVAVLMALTAAIFTVGAAGCTEKGDRENKEHVCTWTAVSVTEADCDQAATATYKCTYTGCEKTKTEKVGSKLGHNEVTFEYIAPTCTQPGYRNVKKCTRCQKITYSEFKIDPTGHDRNFNRYSSDYKGSKPANCQQGAYCGVCGAYDIDPITGEHNVDKGHKPDLLVYKEKTPTCEEIGWFEYVRCQVSGCSYTTYAERAELGHDKALEYPNSKLATCVSLGFCGRCNKEYGDFNNHDKNYVTTSASYCGSKEKICGISKAYCGVCDQYWGDFPQHVLDSFAAKEPTCLAIGNYAYVKCKTCQYTTYEEIEKLGHRVAIIPAVEPTCTTTGWAEGQHCLNCYEILAEPILLKALGHDGERENQETERDLLHWRSYLPDCTHSGYCGLCDQLYGSGMVTGRHDLVTVPAQVATCQADGWDEYIKCKYCHYSTYEENVIPAVPHSPREYPAVEPTCTQPGYEKWTGCIYCMVRPTIPALGHDGERSGQYTVEDLIDSDSYYPNCQRYGYCGICDSFYGTHPNGHVEGVPATCTTPAICKECGEEYGKPWGHTYKNGVCTHCGTKKED